MVRHERKAFAAYAFELPRLQEVGPYDYSVPIEDFEFFLNVHANLDRAHVVNGPRSNGPKNLCADRIEELALDDLVAGEHARERSETKRHNKPPFIPLLTGRPMLWQTAAFLIE